MGVFNVSPLTSPPKVIVNQWSAGGAAPKNFAMYSYQIDAIKSVLSGALTAATYKELLAITGAGVLELAIVSAVDVTSRTFGIKLVFDGITAFDAITGVTTNDQDYGMIAVGHGYTTPASVYAIQPRDYPFNSSLSISVKSSLSETDKIRLWYQYRTI